MLPVLLTLLAAEPTLEATLEARAKRLFEQPRCTEVLRRAPLLSGKTLVVYRDACTYYVDSCGDQGTVTLAVFLGRQWVVLHELQLAWDGVGHHATYTARPGGTFEVTSTLVDDLDAEHATVRRRKDGEGDAARLRDARRAPRGPPAHRPLPRRRHG